MLATCMLHACEWASTSLQHATTVNETVYMRLVTFSCLVPATCLRQSTLLLAINIANLLHILYIAYLEHASRTLSVGLRQSRPCLPRQPSAYGVPATSRLHACEWPVTSLQQSTTLHATVYIMLLTLLSSLCHVQAKYLQQVDYTFFEVHSCLQLILLTEISALFFHHCVAGLQLGPLQSWRCW